MYHLGFLKFVVLIYNILYLTLYNGGFTFHFITYIPHYCEAHNNSAVSGALFEM